MLFYFLIILAGLSSLSLLNLSEDLIFGFYSDTFNLMFIHADLDAFFASVEQKLNPALQGKPVIVTNTDPQGRLCYKGIVSTCSYEARKFGVCSGISVWQARQLCPQGIYVQGHFTEYEKHSQAFFEILTRFSPYLETISLDEGFLDLRGCELLYPNFTTLAQNIKTTTKQELGLICSLGLAKTRVVAKVASDFDKPDGLVVVPAGWEKQFLAPLSLRDLPGVGAKSEIILKTLLGKKNPTIGDFADQKEEWVRQNLGKSGLNLWQAANGQDSTWFQVRNKPQQSISRSVTFSNANCDREYLLAQLRYLTEKVASELFRENLATNCLSITIRTQKFENYSTQAICLPLWQPGDLFSLAQTLFLKIYQSPNLLRLVGIGAGHLTQKNFSLFVENEDKRTKLAQGLQKTRNKYGFETILPASSLLIYPINHNH